MVVHDGSNRPPRPPDPPPIRPIRPQVVPLFRGRTGAVLHPGEQVIGRDVAVLSPAATAWWVLWPALVSFGSFLLGLAMGLLIGWGR